MDEFIQKACEEYVSQFQHNTMHLYLSIVQTYNYYK